MPRFHAARGGGVRLVLEAEEADLLRRLCAELRSLIATYEDGGSDPVAERLFPSAYEDPADQRAFRDLVGDDLEREKLRALEAVDSSLARGPDVTIAADDLSAWLATLTDLRLAIGVRLEVDETRMSSEVDRTDPDAPALTVLHWLGWVQEGILSSAGSGPRPADD